MTSILIHPDELSRSWIDRMTAGGIDILGIHPEGGKQAGESLSRLLRLQQEEAYRTLIDYARQQGLQICYELHAMSFLLDRELFASHPEYFRMDESGSRVADKNFCPSCPEALALVAENAEKLASRLYGSMDRYGFWLDDVRSGKCHCPKCRGLSASDQQLLTCNAMAARLRQSRPQAQIAYLAYFDTLALPVQVRPAEGVFLEFAPMDKWNRLYADAPRFAEGAAQEEKQMALLPGIFPRETATVLEYWIDNSLFSQ